MRNVVLGGRYRVMDRLGEGGMAVVYVALDEKLGRQVAIKVLHQQFADNQDIRQRFEQEATAISAMDHPNILKVYDYSGPNSSQLWIVTEYLKGKNLAKFVAEFPGAAMHPILASCVVLEVCKALDHAHSHQIIHRDIKPENIMMLDNGRIKLMDFGIAKNLHAHNSMTQTGTFMGSPSYMSPEQIRGVNISNVSDIYSLGVLYYEIVTGRLPYIGNTTHDVVLKIMEGRFTQPSQLNPQVPTDLNRVICKTMAREAERRFQSARALGRELAIILRRYDFMESHVELERFFSDRPGFEARLARLRMSRTSRTRSGPESGSSLARTTKDRAPGMTSATVNPGLRETRLFSGQDLQRMEEVRRHNERALNEPIVATARQATQMERAAVASAPRRDHMLPSHIVPQVPRRTRMPTPMPAVRQPTVRIAIEAHAIPPAPPMVLPPAGLRPAAAAIMRKRRVRPRMPQRSRHQGRWLVQSQYRTAQGNLFTAFVGVALVGAVLALLGWSFIQLSDRLERMPRQSGTRLERPELPELRSPFTPAKRVPAKSERANEKVRPADERTVTSAPTARRPNSEVETATKPAKTKSARGEPSPARDLKSTRERATSAPERTVVSVANDTKSATAKAPTEQTPTVAMLPRQANENSQTSRVATESTDRAGPNSSSTDPGYVQIAANLSARILINGKYVGTTIDDTSSSGWKALSPGKHQLQLERPGYTPYSTIIDVKSGERKKLDRIQLTKGESVGIKAPVTIVSKQVPVAVQITNLKTNAVQEQTLQNTHYRLDLEPGRYRIKLTHADKSIVKVIAVTIGAPLTFTVDFSRVE